MPADFSRPFGSGDARVGAATLGAAALVAQQVVGKALRDTLFLGAFGVERLPWAMMAAAGLSAVLVLGLSRAAVARSPGRVARAALLLSAALFLSAWALSGASPRGAALVTYLHAGALSAASVSVFWSLVAECFDPHAARACVPRIMAGTTLGGVLGGLVTWRAAGWLEPRHLLPLGAALNLAALAAVARLERGAGRAHAAESVSWRSVARELPYLRAVALLVVAGALTQAVLEYLLAESAVSSLGPGAPLLSFFALFQTGVGVLSFLVQVGASRVALERFGPGAALAASPALLLGGALAAPFLPPLAGAVLLRGSDGVVGASLHRSAYEVLFAPLAPRARRASKPFLDVGCDRLGTALGSGLVALVTAAAGGGGRGVLLGAVAALALARVLLAPRLQAGYRRTLADGVRDGTLALSEVGVLDRGTAGSLSQAAGVLDRRALLAEIERLRAARARAPPSEGAGARLSVAAFELPVYPDPGDAEEGRGEDPVLAALAELRSGDAERARGVLRARRTEPLLAPQVVELLGDDRVARDAADWLTAQEPAPIGLLADALFAERLPEQVRRRVARLLGKHDDARAAEALVGALPGAPRGVRPGLAHALARAASRRPLPREPLLAAAIRAAAEPPSGDARADLDAIFCLLAAAYPGDPLQAALRALERGGGARGTALEWLDVLLPHEVKLALWPRIVRSGERIAATRRDADALRTALRGRGRGEG